MKQTALLVIDMLNDFVLEGAPLEVPDARTILPFVQDQVTSARRNHIPLFYLCDAHEENDPEFLRMGWPPHALAGTRGAEIVDALQPLPGDTIIFKNQYQAVKKLSTKLEIALSLNHQYQLQVLSLLQLIRLMELKIVLRIKLQISF